MDVIGAGRIGTALAERSHAAGIECTLVDRERGWDGLQQRAGRPILVATRADDLEGVLSRVPYHRRDDLVFVQNGMIRGWLRDKGLVNATRGVLYLAVPKKGAPIEDGGESAFTGLHAGWMAEWFARMDLGVRVVHWGKFSAIELEKLVWLCAFGALGDRFDEDVGTVVENRLDTLTGLANELARVGRASMGVDIPLDVLVDRLVAYARKIPRFRAGVREWKWRHGWFDETAARFKLPTPLHRALLRELGYGDQLDPKGIG